MTSTMRGQAVSFFAAAFIFVIPSVAFPQVPKADDIAACNLEAQRAVRAGTGSAESALPNAKDQSRAAQAREAGKGTARSPTIRNWRVWIQKARRTLHTRPHIGYACGRLAFDDVTLPARPGPTTAEPAWRRPRPPPEGRD